MVTGRVRLARIEHGHLAVEADRRKRYDLIREFERRALRLAYTVPVLWWQRTVVMDRNVRGWQITPSHYLGQDLAEVWLAR